MASDEAAPDTSQAPPTAIPAGWTVLRRDSVDSTSSVARRLAVEGHPQWPVVVWARRQTAGRGRGLHQWWSDEGSLTFTVGLDPAMHALRPEHEPRLALAAAVAVIGAVAPCVPGAVLGIRWPNDVEAGGRKLAGILPERVDTGAGPRVLIGIGLNVRPRLEAAPAEVAGMATTLERLRGSPWDESLEVVLGRILACLEPALAALAAGDPGLPARWRQLDTLAGQCVRVSLGCKVLTGRCLGIDPEGRLGVLSDRGPVWLAGGQVLRDE